MKKLLSIAVVALLPLFTLEECDRGFVPVPAPAGGGGGGYSAPARPAQPSQPLAPGVHKVQGDPGNYNVPGGQEVHWVASRQHCKQLFEKLLKEGENFSTWEFTPSNMPRARKAGHCKLIGPSARDDRFIDKRFETDN